MGEGTILIIDDESIVREVVERYLVREGYSVRTAADGETALQIAYEQQPDLVVLDLMLPKVDGLEVCRRLRAESSVPIIMLTAKGEETDKVVGLTLGADDYMVKPFSPRELVARVQAVLRRAPTASPGLQEGNRVLRFPDLQIDMRTRVVQAGGREVELTPKEFDLLTFLASSPGQVFTRDQLLEKVWDYRYAGDTSTVTVHVRRLREKVEENPMRPRYLKTVWGVGYKFEAKYGRDDQAG
ncbi:MAG: response regulator transcription factor [Dehalococcoidales bacterium]|nr:response regulator transcription factor [Dehalococcoidales bacterium]